jgi:hypothetical protein
VSGRHLQSTASSWAAVALALDQELRFLFHTFDPFKGTLWLMGSFLEEACISFVRKDPAGGSDYAYADS